MSKTIEELSRSFDINKKNENSISSRVDTNDGSFTILTDEIVELSTDSTTTYTFRIETPTVETSTFENFVIDVPNDSLIKFYIYKYQHDDTIEGDFKYNINYLEVDENIVNISDFANYLSRVNGEPNCITATVCIQACPYGYCHSADVCTSTGAMFVSATDCDDGGGASPPNGEGDDTSQGGDTSGDTGGGTWNNNNNSDDTIDEDDPSPVAVVLSLEETIARSINHELYYNPYLLLDIDCDQIENWQSLALHSAPQSVISKINGLPSGTFNDFEIQSLSDANGTMVNLDYFPVRVTTLPNNPNTGLQFNADEFLDYFRRNINSFVSGSTFEPYCEISSICSQETTLWNSSDLTEALVYIDIPFDDGVVICTEYTNAYWRFMTMNAPYAGNHPVSGTRQFGYEQNPDGSYNFYVRGVDRFDSNLIENTAYILSGGNAFIGADGLWSSFQEKLNQFVNSNGGSSNELIPIKNRPDWNKVQDVLLGLRPISDLGCN